MASGWPARRIHRQNALAVDAAHAEVFDLEEFLDAVFRAFAADAAFLHAAKRGDLGRDDAFVDADDAVFEPLGDPPDAADVAAVEIRGETEFGVVGHLDRLVVGFEAVERGDRAEGFLLGDDHVGRHIGQHRRLEEGATECRALAAQRYLGAFLDRVGDVRLDLLDRLHVDQRADHGTRLKPVGHLHGTGGLGQPFGEGVVDAVLHQDAVGAHAGLAGIPVFRGDRTLDRHLYIGIVEDDERRVAAQFHRGLLDRAGALLHQQLADFGRAGEGQLAHRRVRGQLAANLVRRPRYAGKHPLRY